MDHLADQMEAAFRATEGYSDLASSFYPPLRERMESLLGASRTFPDPALYAAVLPGADPAAVRAATTGVGVYLVSARYPELNWPVPVSHTPETVGRWLFGSCDRCDWDLCGRADTEPTSALLVGAGHAVVLFAFCGFCRIALDTEVVADLAWISPCPA